MTTYSIRIGFLLALLSVFLWAGLSHPRTEKSHKNSSGIIFLVSTKTDLSNSLENLKFKDYRVVLREFLLKKTPVIISHSEPVKLTKPVINKSAEPIAEQEQGIVKPTQVESAALLGDIGHTQFVLRLSQRPLYSIHVSDNLQVITLTLDNINPDLSSLPPLDTQETAIRNIVFSDSPTDQLIIAITLQPKVEVQSLRYKDNNLILDVGMGAQIPYVADNKAKNNTQNNTQANSQDNPQANSRDNTDNSEQPVIKKLVPSTPEMLAQENYNEAIDLLNAGNTQGAKELLQMVVAQHADYTQPRILLANILMQQNETAQALAILEGVYPQPNIQEAPDYYNLLAEAYRQSGQPKTAVNIYRQLLTMDGSRGSWWVGLGMCFEALDQLPAAREAYEKAQSSQNLSPVLMNFVAKKLEDDK